MYGIHGLALWGGNCKAPNRIYLVLEYCAGGDLAAYIQRYGKVSEGTARHFMQQLGIYSNLGKESCRCFGPAPCIFWAHSMEWEGVSNYRVCFEEYMFCSSEINFELDSFKLGLDLCSQGDLMWPGMGVCSISFSPIEVASLSSSQLWITLLGLYTCAGAGLQVLRNNNLIHRDLKPQVRLVFWVLQSVVPSFLKVRIGVPTNVVWTKSIILSLAIHVWGECFPYIISPALIILLGT